MNKDEQILKLLARIASNQQKALKKLAQLRPRKHPGEPLEDWERAGVLPEDWQEFDDRVNDEEIREQIEDGDDLDEELEDHAVPFTKKHDIG